MSRQRSHPKRPAALKQRDMNHSQHHPLFIRVIESRCNMRALINKFDSRCILPRRKRRLFTGPESMELHKGLFQVLKGLFKIKGICRRIAGNLDRDSHQCGGLGSHRVCWFNVRILPHSIRIRIRIHYLFPHRWLFVTPGPKPHRQDILRLLGSPEDLKAGLATPDPNPHPVGIQPGFAALRSRAPAVGAVDGVCFQA
jgi:hypothetical protein